MEQTEHAHNVSKARVGVLLVHGLNGNTDDMEELAQLFASHGMVTENMLLPGHGTLVSDMLPIGWLEWAYAVQQECRKLKERCDQVFLIGHSLGGALCLHTATREEVAGVITMCAPLHMFPGMAPAVRIASRVTPLVPTIHQDIRDRAARKRYASRAYRWTPLPPVDSLIRFLPHLRAELPHITVPALIIAAQHDHVIPVRDGINIYHQLGSRQKHLLILRRSYHVVMKDCDREELFTHSLAFIRGLLEQQAA